MLLFMKNRSLLTKIKKKNCSYFKHEYTWHIVLLYMTLVLIMQTHAYLELIAPVFIEQLFMFNLQFWYTDPKHKIKYKEKKNSDKTKKRNRKIGDEQPGHWGKHSMHMAFVWGRLARIDVLNYVCWG